MLTVREVPRRGALLCSVLASVEIVLGTVAAHTWAGGALPSASWIMAIAVLVLVGGLVVDHGKIPLKVAVPALAGLQLLLHSWLVALAPTHSMSGAGMSSTGMSGAGMSSAHSSHLELTTPMVLAHLAAAALTALVWSARRRAIDVLLTWCAQVRVPLLAPALAPAALVRVAEHLRFLLGAASRRGPPLLLARA